MMKLLNLGVTVITSAMIFVCCQIAEANSQKLQPRRKEANPSTGLLTKPATISDNWHHVLNESDRLQQTSDSIPLVRQQECETINPLDYLNNPEKFFRECPTAAINKRRTPDPVETLNIPRLDSGLSVTVTEF
jgi:hypothetical protein